MKWLLVIVLFTVVVWYFGFYGDNAIFKDYSEESGYFMGYELKQ